jgi:hypothetical protein
MTTETERVVFSKAVVSMAGPLAEKRALRGSGPGWVVQVTTERRIAVHEAGHAVLATVTGLYAHRVTVVPDAYSLGHCLVSSSPDTPEEPSEVRTDLDQVCRFAWALTHFDPAIPRWKAVLATARRIRSTAAQFVECHWFEIQALASELERNQHLDRNQIEDCVPNRTGVPFCSNRR